MTATIVPTAVLCGPAEDEGGLCHFWSGGRTICGAPIARDSPGIHRGDTSGDRCTGCGRPRCPACAMEGR